jgi:quercetin dioxygenase-like cupin family protein
MGTKRVTSESFMKTIILSGISLLLSAITLTAQNKQQAVPGNIESCINRFELRPTDKNGNGWAHYYIPASMGDTLTVKMSCVYIGKQTHTPHTHNEDEAFYIIKGPVNFHINGNERILNTGDFVYTPSGSYHNIQRVNETDTIKYLVLKRETTGHVDKPHPVSKPGYTFDDCAYYTAQHPGWAKGKEASQLLLDKHFADGFQVVLSRVTNDSKVFPDRKHRKGGQVALYIINGEASLTLDGQQARIETDNTLYCPKGSAYTIQKRGAAPLVYLTVTTE